MGGEGEQVEHDLIWGRRQQGRVGNDWGVWGALSNLQGSLFLAAQDAIEVMCVTEWVAVCIDLTDVTLVSDDTNSRLYWCDPDHPDESYLVMKVI